MWPRAFAVVYLHGFSATRNWRPLGEVWLNQAD
jgi:hypothetical protein